MVITHHLQDGHIDLELDSSTAQLVSYFLMEVIIFIDYRIENGPMGAVIRQLPSYNVARQL